MEKRQGSYFVQQLFAGVSPIYISTGNRTHNPDISAVLGPALRACTSSFVPTDLGADRQLKARASFRAL